MLTWPLVVLLCIGFMSLAGAALLFIRDPYPKTSGRTPARANERYTPRVSDSNPAPQFVLEPQSKDYDAENS